MTGRAYAIGLLPVATPLGVETPLRPAPVGVPPRPSRRWGRSCSEVGSGASENTRLLLDALTTGGTLEQYALVDVSFSALVRAVTGFETDPALPPSGTGPRLIAVLGSLVGNLDSAQRAAFYTTLCGQLDHNDALLLDADFDTPAFTHHAVWNTYEERVEMRLRSRVRRVRGAPVVDRPGAALRSSTRHSRLMQGGNVRSPSRVPSPSPRAIEPRRPPRPAP
ncbi:L-histidine N(alpha)-methyltransferase [Streptomyces regalis]|uniref:Uncharacterized protein n=1 Tax=Streptomyces regalis TaxID=68262 RepID=A0A0X3USK0_9ACTN|nr:L-histidine N(alpha)-methyltransferase [Streptomyces regalis]KUL35455.1 hypothetical protein ADL12_19910 [Streptomyces regalis]